jgi:hypothetical protein
MLRLVAILTMMLLLTFTGLSGSTLPEGNGIQPNNIGTTVDRAELISFAKKYLGTPYRSGGGSPKRGFDCSGFVNFVFGNFKIRLPRSSIEFKDIGKDLKSLRKVMWLFFMASNTRPESVM